MIQHISKKIIAGIAPDFLMGVGDQAQKADSQIKLIAYILSIYTKRKLFLQPIEKFFLKPFLRKNNLQKAWLEFGELDFETKSEKANRVGALWVQNLLTFNEARSMLGMTSIKEPGEVYYLEWQSSMMQGDSGFGFPSLPTGEREEIPLNDMPLPNGEPVDNVSMHNDPANRKNLQDGGKAPFDPYQKKTEVPKFLPKGDIQPVGSTKQMLKFFKQTPKNITKQSINKLYKAEMPQDYNLESVRDYGHYTESHGASCDCKECKEE